MLASIKTDANKVTETWKLTFTMFASTKSSGISTRVATSSGQVGVLCHILWENMVTDDLPKRDSVKEFVFTKGQRDLMKHKRFCIVLLSLMVLPHHL